MRLGSYETTRTLGRGANGVVTAARTPDGRDVAIKVLARVSQDALARFDRERRLLASFTEDDGFVPLLDAGVHDGAPYLVMPLVAGGTLRDRLRGGALGVERTLALGRSLARSLAIAHARGVVHRDLKPENVLFAEGERPLLADLGLAKHFRSTDPGASASVALSRTNELRGTIGYAPPEQMRDAKSAHPSADVFALGAVLYECLAGRPAFEAPTVLDLLSLVELGRHAPLAALAPDAPPHVVKAIERALDPDPARRFVDARAFLVAIEGGARAARPRLALVAAGFVGSGAIVAALLLVSRDRPTAPPKAPDVAVASSADATPKQWSAREWVLHAEALEARGLLDEALDSATRAIELDARDADAWCRRATIRGRKGDHVNARMDALRATQVDPSMAHAWSSLAGARLETGDGDGAREAAERAVALAPRLVLGWYQLGIAHQRGQRHAEAVAAFDTVLSLDERFVPAWTERAMELHAMGDAASALASAERGVELARTPRALSVRGYLRQQKGDAAGAASDLEETTRLSPRDKWAWRTLASVLNENREWDRAIAAATRALELDARYGEAFGERGWSHLNKEDYAHAEEDFSKQLALETNDPLPWTNRGQARLFLGNPRGAIDDETRALQLAPRLAAGYHRRGVGYFQTEQLAKAEADFTRALELQPEATDSIAMRARTRHRLGNVAGAREDYERALARAGNEPLAASLRDDRARLERGEPPRWGAKK